MGDTYISSQSLNYNLNYNYYQPASNPYQQLGQHPVYPPIGAPPGQSYGEQQQHHNQAYNWSPRGGQQQYKQQPPAPPAPQTYRAPAAGHPPDANTLFTVLDETVKEKGICDMYPEAKLRLIAAELAEKDPINTLCNRWKLEKEISLDLVKLALFDVVFLLDDSASMRFNEGHIEELKFILSSVAFATGLFDRDGFCVRFMNSDVRGDNIRTGGEAAAFVDQVRFEGVTPLAASLKDKVLDPYVYGRDRAGKLRKPILVRIITDGKPTDNAHAEFQQHIRMVSHHFGGRGVVSFQITQVGVDKGAQEFLAQLDTDESIGSLIDCTSNFELESIEWKSKGLELSKHDWYKKLLMGGIASSYDGKVKTKKTPAPSSCLPQQVTRAPRGYHQQPSVRQESAQCPPSQWYGSPPPRQHYRQRRIQCQHAQNSQPDYTPTPRGHAPSYNQAPGFGQPQGQQGWGPWQA